MRSPSKRPATRQQRRSLRELLRSVIQGTPAKDTTRGSLMLESLEKRQLLAGDVEFLFTEAEAETPNVQAAETGGLQVEGQAEGELVDDLVQFAKDLTAAGVRFFGAEWCPACTAQKELFEDGQEFLDFIEVTDPDLRALALSDPSITDTRNSVGIAEGITVFPTWEFPDLTRETGVLSLETISQRANVPIPQGETPSFVEIGDQVVRIGSPLHIPIDGYDPDGGPLTVTVEVDDPSLLEAVVLSGNRSIRIDMATYGDMVFELFEQRAPDASGRVIELAEDGFYDGIIFHRIVDNFVIQAGDPNGIGTGGSALGTFDDDFHPELQHNRSGVLSFAKSSDDTNNSQFFVTEVPTRFLDFNHSIFGQLVEGEKAREAISEQSSPQSRTGLQTASAKPEIDIPIETVEVFTDTENSVVMLRPTGTGTGTTNVTFTITDQDNNTFSETVSVTVAADNANSQPYLDPIATPAPTPTNNVAQLQLGSTDIEGDAVSYFAQQLTGGGSVAVDSATGLVSVTPNTDFVGTIEVRVGVEPGAGVVGNGSNDMDTQVVSFQFEGEGLVAPQAPDLLDGSDTGANNTDNITNAGSLTFVVDGADDGATVELIDVASGDVIGTGVASSPVEITTNNIAALGDGTYQIAARQRLNGQTSALSQAITLVYDATAPGSVVGSAALNANVNREYVTDLISNEEGSGLSYALTSAPTGATIDATTGLVRWTPTSDQLGNNTFTVELTDLAGNVRTEPFTVNVAGEPLAEVRLEITDLQGNPITSLAVGQEFLLNMIGVDARAFNKPGVYGVYADILFDSDLIRPVPGSSIEYSDDFTLVRKGTFQNGLINELGAINRVLAASGDPENLIATVRMEALASGTVNILSDPADDVDSEFLLFGIDDLIPAESVAFGSVSLAIGQNFTVGDDSFTVAEDSGATVLDVLANDQIVSGSTVLSVVSVEQPTSGGTVSLSGGEVSFTPTANFNGEAVFTYRVSDTGGVQDVGTVTVTVTSVNDAPTAVEDTFNVDTNSSDNVLDVLANDEIAPDTGETLLVDATSGTSQNGGTVSIANNGQSVSYTPPTDFTGTDTFTYTVTDGALTDTVTVSVTVTTPDNPPTANPDSFTVTEDDAEASFDILTNDDRDVDNQTFVIDSVGTPSDGGSVRISNDGTEFFYSPRADFFGTETVTYTIRDTGGGLSVGSITFTVEGANDAPPILNPNVTLNRASGDEVVFNQSDLPANVDGSDETLTVTVTTDTSEGGTARFDAATGQIIYTPPSDTFVGTDTISYSVTDGELTSNGTISVEVVDFATRTITVNLASSGLSRVGGVTLKGTNLLGETVEVPLNYREDTAAFEDILPGDYMIEFPAIPFLQGGETARQIPLNSAPEEGDETVEAALGRLRPEFVSIQDFIGSAPRKSLLVAVAPGESSVLAMQTSATDTISDPVVLLDAAGSNLTIRGQAINGDGTTPVDVEATIPAQSDSRVQVRGEIDGLRLLKISVEDDDVTFEEPATSGAEGESSLPAENSEVDGAVALQSFSEPEAEPFLGTSSLVVGDQQAEGESAGSASVSRADVFVPVARDVSTRVDATVLALEEGDVWMGDPQSSSGANDVDAGVDPQAVDTAMQSVASSLTVQSSAADAVAREEEERINESVVDELLSDEL